ncbi:hypothetical protein HCN73_06460 [Lactobacillus crispatus]|uniref:DUF7679 family protein n=1 Tax=Lactobacillus crispatus TaxID=47770 RepID=UPI0015EBA598|nr:hypothetical protein [Lactobacillus crispatus]MBA2915976.1 hypothetical protein [Lactobacillus crispatus]MBI1698295.1 hypothetical protein [Lactobacillus crispatus]
MAKRHQYLWCLVELPNGKREWYCISKVLRKALLWEKNYLHNRYWRNTLIGSYLNVARTRYHHDRAIITVGRVIRVKILYYPTRDWHWTRNQFIAASQLENFTTAYNYMKHNYAWYNKLSIHHALRHWRRISASKHCNKF